MIKHYINTSILAITLLANNPCFAKIEKETLDKVIAVVNNHVITNSELESEVNLIKNSISQTNGLLPSDEKIKRKVLDTMINDLVQLDYANELGIETDEISVNDAIKQIASRQGLTISELRRLVREEGMNYDYFYKKTKKDLTLQKLYDYELRSKISVSKQDVDLFLNSPVGQELAGYEFHLGHILISLPKAPSPETLKVYETKAQELVKKLKNNENFTKIAQIESKDNFALNGGDLGWRKVAELPTLFEEHVPTMGKGEVKGPFRSGSGFHIIKLFDKKIGDKDKIKEIHAHHILIKTKDSLTKEQAIETLNNIKTQIAKGEDFNKLAAKYSEDIRTNFKGGDLGYLNIKHIPSVFAKVAKNLEKGKISEPFQTDSGWHIIKLVDKREKTPSLETIRLNTQALLKQRKFEEGINPWLLKLKDEAIIEMYIDDKTQTS